MSRLTNKIEAQNRSILEVLDDKKYTVDYFQREYKWESKHIEQLVSDLTSSFLDDYRPDHRRKDIENYNSYYLGPFVVSIKDGGRSIIDGQQRLTSLTLLLIYLNNLQKTLGLSEKLESLIFSEKYGEKSFNINVPERNACLEQLFIDQEYKQKDDDDESTINMAKRYDDIETAFPEEIKGSVLPFFIDWLKYNVVLVEIIAYSDENAYTIFETMNDRGLNLTQSEMLKGFILSKFEDSRKRQKANELWKVYMQELHSFTKDQDLQFFQAWFRAQYADTLRQRKAGSQNEDFEKIGTRFHSWFRDNLAKVGIAEESSEDFENFVETDLRFFLKAYMKILDASEKFDPQLEYVYYSETWSIATSLGDPLFLAPLSKTDTEDIVNAKLNLVAKYIETFTVRRSINFRKFSSSSISYTIYTLVKEIRNADVDSLREILKRKVSEMEESWDGIDRFRLHGQNKVFVKFLLSRITAFVEQHAGMNSSFEKYFHNPKGKPYEVEHILADKFNEHRDEFEQESEFQEFRNRLGALILLPRGTNQSFSAKPFDQKLKHYIKENLLTQSLCELTYQNNPNFLSMRESLQIPFKPHNDFRKGDIEERQRLYKVICERIWDWKN